MAKKIIVKKEINIIRSVLIMAVTAEIYAQFFKNALRGNLDDLEGAGALECMLLDTNHSFSEADQSVDDIVSNEIADEDYSRQSLTGVSVTQGTDTDTNLIKLDADDISFGTTVSISASHAVIYTVGIDDTDSYLMFDINFGETQESVDGEFTLEVHADGLYDVVT